MILILDNFDSFTYNLVDYLRQLHVEVEVQRNNIPLNDITLSKYKGIILSPGPQTPAKAGNMMDLIKESHNKLPILGICLGHQALGVFFGATLEKAQQPMHGKCSSFFYQHDYLFEGLENPTQIVRYHSWIVNELPNCLTALGHTPENEIMALKHNHLPIRGLQFHPEAILTTLGKKILDNWVVFNQIRD